MEAFRPDRGGIHKHRQGSQGADYEAYRLKHIRKGRLRKDMIYISRSGPFHRIKRLRAYTRQHKSPLLDSASKESFPLFIFDDTNHLVRWGQHIDPAERIKEVGDACSEQIESDALGGIILLFIEHSLNPDDAPALP